MVVAVRQEKESILMASTGGSWKNGSFKMRKGAKKAKGAVAEVKAPSKVATKNATVGKLPEKRVVNTKFGQIKLARTTPLTLLPASLLDKVGKLYPKVDPKLGFIPKSKLDKVPSGEKVTAMFKGHTIDGKPIEFGRFTTGNVFTVNAGSYTILLEKRTKDSGYKKLGWTQTIYNKR